MPHHPRYSGLRSGRCGFTLVELLVVVSIIALLIAILVPSLRNAREQSKAAVCLAQFRVLGQGLTMYALDNQDVMVPGRLPKVDDENWRSPIAGGVKYRPTFLATMGAFVGIPAFDDPQSSKTGVDRFGEPGDRQNYSNRVYVCPSAADWTDERNGCYGYNYQFLGNSRLRDGGDVDDYKNWPTNYTRVRSPAECVAVADSMGTAGSYAARRDYVNNSRDADRYGNEGFNLDPPWVDPDRGEMANYDSSPQAMSPAHDRHLGTASVLWMDGHGDRRTLKQLGYKVEPDGVVAFDGNNRYFHIEGKNEPWLQD